jgi:serine phosphatase RsbU (regulator of sigma subunit)
MPYALLYQAQGQTVSPIELKGLPLGFVADIPYELREIPLAKGDTILLMSDGLPEMFNPEKELFGDDQVIAAFQELAEKPTQDIIDGLIQKAAAWGDMDNLRDDITLLVIRRR